MAHPMHAGPAKCHQHLRRGGMLRKMEIQIAVVQYSSDLCVTPALVKTVSQCRVQLQRTAVLKTDFLSLMKPASTPAQLSVQDQGAFEGSASVACIKIGLGWSKSFATFKYTVKENKEVFPPPADWKLSAGENRV